MKAKAWLTLIIGLALLACKAPAFSPSNPTPVVAQVVGTPAVTVIVVTVPPTPTTQYLLPNTPTTPLTSNSQPTTSSPSPTATPDPNQSSACTRPPDDMTRVQVNGQTVSARTLWMLQLAQHLYGGPGSMLRVVQGSYSPGLAESFGTHDAGGAVDISIRNPANPTEVLWDEAPKMVAALRQAGFAAWYRPAGALGPGSTAHIHAIAIGDPELSEAARQQLDGPEGYLRGLDGIPPQYGGPHPDPHGGPVICPWMIELGYRDLR